MSDRGFQGERGIKLPKSISCEYCYWFDGLKICKLKNTVVRKEDSCGEYK